MPRKDIKANEVRKLVDEVDEMRPLIESLIVDQAEIAAFPPDTRANYKKDLQSMAGKIQTRIANLVLATEKSKHNTEFEKAVKEVPMQELLEELLLAAEKLGVCLQFVKDSANMSQDNEDEEEHPSDGSNQTEHEVNNDKEDKEKLTEDGKGYQQGQAILDSLNGFVAQYKQDKQEQSVQFQQIHGSMNNVSAQMWEIEKRVLHLEHQAKPDSGNELLYPFSTDNKQNNRGPAQAFLSPDQPFYEKPVQPWETAKAQKAKNGQKLVSPSQPPMVWDTEDDAFFKIQGNNGALDLRPQPEASQLNEQEIAKLRALVPTEMLVTPDGIHLFEQFNTEESRQSRKAYRGAYSAFYQGVNIPKFDGTGVFITFWKRYQEKSNQICISDGEKLDLLRSSVTGYLVETLSTNDMSAKGLFDAVMQLFKAYYQSAERQLKALRTILCLPKINADYTDIEATFGKLHSAAKELQATSSNDVRTKHDVISKFPPAVSSSFLIKYPTVISTTPILEMVELLQEHTRGFANNRQVEIVQYDIQAQNIMCPFCQEKGHRPSLCTKLTGTQDQWNSISYQGRCHICLEMDHDQSSCKGNKCGSCGGNHHSKFHKLCDLVTKKDTTSFNSSTFNRRTNSNTPQTPRRDGINDRRFNQTSGQRFTPKTSTNTPAVSNFNQASRNTTSTPVRRQEERRTNIAEEQSSGSEDEDEEQIVDECVELTIQDDCGQDFFLESDQQ